MSPPRLAGGPTQDEVLAVSLFKLGLRHTDTVLEIGSGTGKVTEALARQVYFVYSIDKRDEAVSITRDRMNTAKIMNVSVECRNAEDFLVSDQVFDCAFMGGTKNITTILPLLVPKVRRTIVINAVLLSTLQATVQTLQELNVFSEAVQVQVTRSHDLAGSIMFKPVDPVFIITGRGSAC